MFSVLFCIKWNASQEQPKLMKENYGGEICKYRFVDNVFMLVLFCIPSSKLSVSGTTSSTKATFPLLQAYNVAWFTEKSGSWSITKPCTFSHILYLPHLMCILFVCLFVWKLTKHAKIRYASTAISTLSPPLTGAACLLYLYIFIYVTNMVRVCSF